MSHTKFKFSIFAIKKRRKNVKTKKYSKKGHHKFWHKEISKETRSIKKTHERAMVYH